MEKSEAPPGEALAKIGLYEPPKVDFNTLTGVKKKETYIKPRHGN
jgi:hypothetical protein